MIKIFTKFMVSSGAFCDSCNINALIIRALLYSRCPIVIIVCMSVRISALYMVRDKSSLENFHKNITHNTWIKQRNSLFSSPELK